MFEFEAPLVPLASLSSASRSKDGIHKKINVFLVAVTVHYRELCLSLSISLFSFYFNNRLRPSSSSLRKISLTQRSDIFVRGKNFVCVFSFTVVGRDGKEMQIRCDRCNFRLNSTDSCRRKRIENYS